MSIIVTGAAVAMGLAMGRWLSRRAMRTSTPRPASSSPAEPAAAAPAPNPWDRFACRLGDVVVRQDGAEAWLAGALLLHEDAPAAVLFVAPEAKADRAVFLRAKPSTELLWLVPIDSDAWKSPGADPPSTIEVGGEAYERIRRLPFRAERLGEGTPDIGPDVIVAEYKSLRDEEKRVISILSGGRARAWRGEKIDLVTCDILPSGTQTS